MQDLVIIPTYDRPELLWLCLEHVARSPHYPQVQLRVVVDAHIGQPLPPRAEIERVLEKFPQLSIQVGYRTPHQFSGNSFNVLTAFQEAFESEARYVFLIEDDVLVHPQFFAWHWATHATLDIGCSIAVENPGHGAYASLGVCFRRERLALIQPHCKTAYFQNMREYCRTTFPPSAFDCEQDGLWARVLKGHLVQWATFPYAQHVGWYGYHRRRSIRPYGTLEERYQQVIAALSSSHLLQHWMKDFGDIVPLRQST